MKCANLVFQYQQTNPIYGLMWSIWLRSPPLLRRSLYQLLSRVYHSRWWAGPTTINGVTCPLPFGLYSKPCRSQDEAVATEYARTHTTIPVPHVLDVVPTGCQYLPWLMIYRGIPGIPAFARGSGHALRYATEQQHQIVRDMLTDWLTQLRSLDAPPFGPYYICSFSGGPIYSHRIGEELVGPFETAAEFHSQDFCHTWEEQGPGVKELREWRANQQYPVNFVHGDFQLHNIILDKDSLRPCGLIDWECAGWMPGYWEKAVAGRSTFGRMWCWRDIVKECFPAYENDMCLDAYVHTHWLS